ncbi:MAG: hypothetical protein EPO26_16480 [Chloroflexota bacterium]|nr:MAG: hypothetical protein EPO26_16480 [Chloroflexota bacterium]
MERRIDPSLSLPERTAPTVPFVGEAPANPVVSTFPSPDDDRPAIRRPLALIDGHAYAVAWSPTPDAVPSGSRYVVVRDDGVAFGHGPARSPDDLPYDIAFPIAPRRVRLWRQSAIESYLRGLRPDPSDLLARLEACYDTFIDFGFSGADQSSICLLLASLSISTWFADAFPIIPYLWIGGERGAGKTHLGTVWAATSHLGEVILSASSPSAVRDLASLGAALYFDDAESAVRARRGGALDRELLLAGNRRGAHVLVRRATARGESDWIAVYAPRAFSAIAPPDATLASRAIIVPLTRTIDPVRAQRDPADPFAWPCDRRALIDHLWAFALANLTRAETAWRTLEDERSLLGREFEKWRPLIAIAQILEDGGVADCVSRLRAVIGASRNAAHHHLLPDETSEVIAALAHVVVHFRAMPDSEIASARHVWFRSDCSIRIDNALILRVVQEVAPEGSLASRAERSAASRIGRAMARLGFQPSRASGSGRARGWVVNLDRVVAIAGAHGIPLPAASTIDDGPGARAPHHGRTTRV